MGELDDLPDPPDFPDEDPDDLDETPNHSRRYDWDQVRTVYVEGLTNADSEQWWPSIREAAEICDVPYSRARKYSARDDWATQRIAYQTHLERVRQKRRADEMAEAAVQLDQSALTMSKAGLQLVSVRMQEIATRVKERNEQVAAGDTMAALMPGVDAREMETLGRAASIWHNLGLRAIGETEALRIELTGADAGPIDVRSSIRAELVRDDPERLHGFIVALERAGLPAALERGDLGDEPGGEA